MQKTINTKGGTTKPSGPVYVFDGLPEAEAAASPHSSGWSSWSASGR